MGFDEEGRLRGRVRGADGALIDDISMARLRPAADTSIEDHESEFRAAARDGRLDTHGPQPASIGARTQQWAATIMLPCSLVCAPARKDRAAAWR